MNLGVVAHSLHYFLLHRRNDAIVTYACIRGLTVSTSCAMRWDLQAWVKMYLMRRKLEQQLIKDLPEFNKLIKELKENDRGE